MHLIILAEAIERNHERFKAWVSNQEFSTGGHPVIREIKVYDINIKESDQERFLDMLIPSEVNWFHGAERGNKFKFITKIISKFLPIESLAKEKEESRQRHKERKGVSAHETWDWLYLYIIGKLKDDYDEFGVERI